MRLAIPANGLDLTPTLFKPKEHPLHCFHLSTIMNTHSNLAVIGSKPCYHRTTNHGVAAPAHTDECFVHAHRQRQRHHSQHGAQQLAEDAGGEHVGQMLGVPEAVAVPVPPLKSEHLVCGLQQ